jgi:hypothetical protein
MARRLLNGSEASQWLGGDCLNEVWHFYAAPFGRLVKMEN